MKKTIFLWLLISLFGVSIFAQSDDKKDQDGCFDLTITGPAAVVQPGETGNFIMTVSGYEGKSEFSEFQITWTVDKGKIIEGQGTESIKVIFPEQGELSTATATVISPEGCIITGSETAIPGDPPEPVLIDEIGTLQTENLRHRMDQFLVELKNDPGSTGYVVFYGKERQIKKAKEIFDAHIKYREFNMDRFVFVNGEKEKNLRIRLWRVPAGALPESID